MFYSIQYLRFIAASLVVATHLFGGMGKVGRGDLPNNFTLGESGVDMFFVISGLIMCLITDTKESDPVKFLGRRFARIAPAYWFITTVCIVAIVAEPSWFNSYRVDAVNAVMSFIFVAWPSAAANDPLPPFQGGWTLNHEFFFYALFAISMAVSQRWRMLICSVVIGAFTLFHFTAFARNEILSFYTRPLIFEFVLGISISYLLRANVVVPRVVSLTIIAVGAVLLVMLQRYYPVWRLSDARLIIWGVPSAVIVCGFVLLEPFILKSPILRLLGDSSYSLYLTHFFTIHAITLLWGKLHLKAFVPDIMLVLSGYLASIVVGILFSVLIERPGVSLARRFMSQHVTDGRGAFKPMHLTGEIRRSSDHSHIQKSPLI